MKTNELQLQLLADIVAGQAKPNGYFYKYANRVCRNVESWVKSNDKLYVSFKKPLKPEEIPTFLSNLIKAHNRLCNHLPLQSISVAIHSQTITYPIQGQGYITEEFDFSISPHILG